MAKQKLTVNGFTPAFERAVLRAEKEIHDYFLYLKIPKRYDIKLKQSGMSDIIFLA